MRSVVVVLPASMWAMIPMFRVRSRGNSRAICHHFFVNWGNAHAGHRTKRRPRRSPSVVREGLIRLSHLLQGVAPLYRGTDAVRRVEQLVGQTLRHRLFAPLPREADDPADGQCVGPAGPHLDCDLMGGPTRSPPPPLDRRAPAFA